MAEKRDKFKNSVNCELIKRDFTLNPQRLKRPLIMGVDPGISGAVAVVDIDARSLVDLIDIPTFEEKSESRSSGFKKMVDIHKLSSLIDAYSDHTALAVIEEPGAMPGQGLSSTFRFGHTCGLIHGVLAGHYVPVIPVRPAAWKLSLGLSRDKDMSMGLAALAFPGFEYLWALKKHNDRAEAALLAVYGMKFLQNIIALSRK